MDDIAFRKGDMGSMLVIMEKNNYMREAHNQIFSDKHLGHFEVHGT